MSAPQLLQTVNASLMKAVSPPTSASLPPQPNVMPGRAEARTPLGSVVGRGHRASHLMYRVGGEVWDLTRPLEGDCKLEYCSFEEPEGREVRPAPPGTTAPSPGPRAHRSLSAGSLQLRMGEPPRLMPHQVQGAGHTLPAVVPELSR